MKFLYLLASSIRAIVIPEGGIGVRTPPLLKNHKNIGFLSNTSPGPLKNKKKNAHNFMLGHHRPTSKTP